MFVLKEAARIKDFHSSDINFRNIRLRFGCVCYPIGTKEVSYVTDIFIFLKRLVRECRFDRRIDHLPAFVWQIVFPRGFYNVVT